MIDSARWTQAEREVVYAAVQAYQVRMRRTAESHTNSAVRARAQWHAYEAERICADIDGR